MTPDECWDLIQRLPRDSAYMAEVAADPDAVLAGGEWRPSMAEWSPETEALAAVHDKLAAIDAKLAALISGKSASHAPYPRPYIAAAERAERERRERRDRLSLELCIRLTGKGWGGEDG